MRDILSEIAASTAQSIGTEFLAALVKSMREAMEAKLVFITTGVGDPVRRARSLASWQQGVRAKPSSTISRARLAVSSMTAKRWW